MMRTRCSTATLIATSFPTRLSAKGQTHLGFTNHGVLGGALEHVHACRHPEKYENPVDPGKKRSADERLMAALGIEAYWRPSRFMDLSDKELYGKNGHNWAQHLCLHAGSLAGWRTLLRLSAKSWVRKEKGGGFYGKPVMDMDMIKNDHEGLHRLDGLYQLASRAPDPGWG